MNYLFRSLFPNEDEPKTWLEKFLIAAIILSVICVVLETETLVQQQYKSFFFYFEIVITSLFSLEYLARLILVKEYKGRCVVNEVSLHVSEGEVIKLEANPSSFHVFDNEGNAMTRLKIPETKN